MGERGVSLEHVENTENMENMENMEKTKKNRTIKCKNGPKRVKNTKPSNFQNLTFCGVNGVILNLNVGLRDHLGHFVCMGVP